MRRHDEPKVSSVDMCSGLRLLASVLMVAALSACAQSSIVKPASLAASRSASPEIDRTHTAVITKKHSPFANSKEVAQEVRDTSYGIASFYADSSETASGEKVNSGELTAAHRTLPFGTRLRVTDVATGRSVTVRVNDRGPFVPGRIVDVSSSAAETLGIVGRGVAKVKLDVIQ